MKKNGFTIIEVVLSLAIASVTLLTLFQIIFLIRNVYSDSGLKVKLLQKQLIINEKINYDFSSKKLLVARKCSNTCVEFTFQTGEIKKLEYDRQEKIFKYDNYTTKLIGRSTFGNIEIKNEKSFDESYLENDSVLVVDIPIYNPSFPGENFGLNVVYQYDSDNVSIDSINIYDELEGRKQIFLIGGEDYTVYTTMDYEDPGYYLRSADGSLVENSKEVVVTGSVPKVPGVYEVIYTYSDSLGNIIDTKIRNVTVLEGVKDFSYIGECEEYSVPGTGTYKLEVWGASGGSSSEYDLGGNGAYTVGYKYLTKGTNITVCVGGSGKAGNTGTIENPTTDNTPGGFNGGGTSVRASVFAGGSGGGATDIRTTADFIDTLIVAGGGGGSASRNDSAYPSVGGAGGGGTGTSLPESYNGIGGTYEAGGSKASFVDASITKQATEGRSLYGGDSGLYSDQYSGGAGGGGYYGGGGGVRFGSGGGGSSYCDGTINCTMMSGDSEITSPDGSITTGHVGDGYARVSLINF